MMRSTNKGLRRMSRMIATLPRPPTFHTRPVEVKADTSRILSQARSRLDDIASGKVNAVEGYAEMESEMTGPAQTLCFYQYVSQDAGLRQASEEAEKLFSDFGIETLKREDVYKKLAETDSNLLSQPVDQRYWKKLLNDYNRNGLGLGLSTSQKQRLETLEKRLSDVCIKYNSNIGNDTSYETFSRDELSGLSESVLGRLEKTADGKLKVTYKAPDLSPILQECNVESTRKIMWLGSENQVPENDPLFREALQLRQEIAEILGFKNHAEYVLADCMAESPSRVRTFLQDLLGGASAVAAKELEEFEQIKGGPVYAWDSAWCQNKVLEQRYNVDQELISQYFPALEVVKRMFGVFHDVMGLDFIPVTDLAPEERWHEDVVCYAIMQQKEFKGYLYLDMYPRENKYNHFAEFGLIPGFNHENKRQHPVSALVCNFPSSGLLKHQDVVTFFHELGHGIHATLGISPYSRFAGTNVARDFVETPSQLLENWIWDPEQLRRVSCHHETGEPLPDSLIQALVASKRANVGTFVLRQLFFGLFDLKVHSASVDPLEVWQKLRYEITRLPCPEKHAGYCKFAHLMGGYDAGYYGYMWSLVFAADIWHSLFAANPLDPHIGRFYRDTVLAVGGSRDENQVLRDLLGRSPSPKAFYAELGISIESSTRPNVRL